MTAYTDHLDDAWLTVSDHEAGDLDYDLAAGPRSPRTPEPSAAWSDPVGEGIATRVGALQAADRLTRRGAARTT